MSGIYQPLTEEARHLKRQLSPCVQYALWIAELEEECGDLRGMRLSEETRLENQLRQMRQDWEARRREASRLLTQPESLTSLERRILRLRYLCASPWDGICVQVHRESGAVYAAYRRALNKLAEAGDGAPE